MESGDKISLGGSEKDGAGVFLAFSKDSTWCPVTGEDYLARQEQPLVGSSHNMLFSFRLLLLYSTRTGVKNAQNTCFCRVALAYVLT